MAIKMEGGSQHWYQCQGAIAKPQHDATLREARKEKLYASITTVDKATFKNDFLDAWKLNELAEAAYDYPPMEHESKETYAQRVYEVSLTKSLVAADFGKEIHDAIEHYPQMPLDPKLVPWIEKFEPWYKENIDMPLASECILFDHDLGLAGRCDKVAIGKGKFEGKIILPDWKTQRVKLNKKGKKEPAFYDSWCRQLAFYCVSYAKLNGCWPDNIPVAISVIIDSNEPDSPFVKVWTTEEIRSAYEDVVLAAYSFYKKRQYWPQPNGPIEINHPKIPLPYS